MTADAVRDEWAKAERDLANATVPVQVVELTEKAELLYEEYIQAEEAEAVVRRVNDSDLLRDEDRIEPQRRL